ncbi:MAG: hypothetical protein JWN70_452, partial [Planctomycetaceae bacterium]|nr:hypothetical protein [Planctomycetaceae bacterium]
IRIKSSQQPDPLNQQGVIKAKLKRRQSNNADQAIIENNCDCQRPDKKPKMNGNETIAAWIVE